jgi:serine phosphatase RsbU (regulator of sigma subunit)
VHLQPGAEHPVCKARNQRLQQILRQNAKASAQTVKLAILEAVAEFRGNQIQEDDLTLVVIKVNDG